MTTSSKSESNRPATTPLRAAIVQVTPFQQNCSLVYDEETKVGALVDPGGDVDRIEAAISQLQLKIEKILLTHGHIDHAGGAEEMRRRLSVTIEGPHKADEFLLRGLANQGRTYGIDATNVQPDRWLDEGDEIIIAGRPFEILHCPGHSPGSVVMFNKAQRFALVGDVIFAGSIGRTDFPYGDHAALIDAITTKLLPLGDDVTFICGHGPTSTLGRERQSNPFLR